MRKLPHTLVESFKSTLAEVADAHLILHVADACDPFLKEQIAAVEEVLGQIDACEAPRVLVFNKADLLDADKEGELRAAYPEALFVSAAQRTGIDELIAYLAQQAALRDECVCVLIPYDKGALLSECHKVGHILAEEYVEDGVLVEAVVPRSLANRMAAFKRQGR